MTVGCWVDKAAERDPHVGYAEEGASDQELEKPIYPLVISVEL